METIATDMATLSNAHTIAMRKQSPIIEYNAKAALSLSPRAPTESYISSAVPKDDEMVADGAAGVVVPGAVVSDSEVAVEVAVVAGSSNACCGNAVSGSTTQYSAPSAVKKQSSSITPPTAVVTGAVKVSGAPSYGKFRWTRRTRRERRKW